MQGVVCAVHGSPGDIFLHLETSEVGDLHASHPLHAQHSRGLIDVLILEEAHLLRLSSH